MRNETNEREREKKRKEGSGISKDQGKLMENWKTNEKNDTICQLLRIPFPLTARFILLLLCTEQGSQGTLLVQRWSLLSRLT